MDYNKKAIEMHAKWQGKIEVVPRCEINGRDDLSVAYTPGVARPCVEIRDNPDLSYTYTRRGNMVAVISDGSAVLGLGNIGALAAMPLSGVQALLGKKWGQQLHDFANGVDDSPVSEEAEQAKGYSVSTTLAEDVTDLKTAHQILLELADSVTSRMRADGVRASCVSVSIRTNTFQNRSHQKKLYEPTDITKEVYEVSKTLLDELWKTKVPLRLLGVALTQLESEETAQLSLFPDEKKEKARTLDRTLDNIRSRFGADTVKRGSTYRTKLDVGKKYKAQLAPEQNEQEDSQ